MRPRAGACLGTCLRLTSPAAHGPANEVISSSVLTYMCLAVSRHYCCPLMAQTIMKTRKLCNICLYQMTGIATFCEPTLADVDVSSNGQEIQNMSITK